MKFLLCWILCMVAILQALPDTDLVSQPPGMDDVVIYSGYVKTANSGRQLHYIFVQAATNPLKAPLTIWYNGGPGCSSLIGMLQQIGPYKVGNSYKYGDKLTKNQYSWHQVSNLLFFQSPAIVGFSTDTDSSIHYTDQQTAQDNFYAVKDFLFSKAPQFNATQLYLAGQSYAGKYIPDLAVKIIENNQAATSTYINLKGILVGNGVINFLDFSLQRSQIQYVIQHDFISQRLKQIYQTSCSINYQSPRCLFFQYQLAQAADKLNPYSKLSKNYYYLDVYQICQNVQTFQLKSILKQNNRNNQRYYKNHNNNNNNSNNSFKIPNEIIQCLNDNGAISYWNINKQPYHIKNLQKQWFPCSYLDYQIDYQGSVKQYNILLKGNTIRKWIYTGDWDSVVPIVDTLKNLQYKLYTRTINQLLPWFYNKQHVGFYQDYSNNLKFITIKSAGHMVPQIQPIPSYIMFTKFINNSDFKP